MRSPALPRFGQRAGRVPQTNFQHLIANKWRDKTRYETGAPSRISKNLKFTLPKDRVPLFNMEPGDHVIVRSGPRKHAHGIVWYVDRPNNELLVEGEAMSRTEQASRPDSGSGDESADSPAISRPVPIQYSRLSLVIPRDTLDPSSIPALAADKAKNLLVVAARLKARRLRYNPIKNRYEWNRIPAKVRLFDRIQQRYLPQPVALPVNVKDKTTRILWPAETIMPKDKVYEKTDRETEPEAALAVSFTPLAQPYKRLLPELSVPYSEFGNVNSRARRTDRWNVRNRDPLTWKIVPRVKERKLIEPNFGPSIKPKDWRQSPADSEA